MGALAEAVVDDVEEADSAGLRETGLDGWAYAAEVGGCCCCDIVEVGGFRVGWWVQSSWMARYVDGGC